MKKLILLLFILLLLPFICNAGMIIQTVASGGSSTVKIGSGSAADITGTTSAVLLSTPGSTIDEDPANPGYGNDARECLLYLDISAVITEIGAGKTITGASINLYHTTVDDNPTDQFAQMKQMLVYSGNASSMDYSDVSWDEKEVTENVQWGGDTQVRPLSGTDYNATPLVSIDNDSIALDGFTEFTSASLTTLVSGWYGSTTTNHGIILINTGAFNGNVFAGDTNVTSANRYYWEITYTD